MALTRDLREIEAEMCESAGYRRGLLAEAAETYLEGNTVIGNGLLDSYLTGTGAFAEVADRLGVRESELRYWVRGDGNARTKRLNNLFEVCLEREGVRLVVNYALA